MGDFMAGDYLGLAAEARRKAKTAIKERRLDDAWRLLHEQQSYWLRDAEKKGSSQRQALSLISSIHEDLANIQRIEGKHQGALASLMYCLAANSRPTKSQEKKLTSYFNRCKFKGVSEADLEAGIKRLRRSPDLRAAQEMVHGWKSSEPEN